MEAIQSLSNMSREPLEFRAKGLFRESHGRKRLDFKSTGGGT